MVRCVGNVVGWVFFSISWKSFCSSCATVNLQRLRSKRGNGRRRAAVIFLPSLEENSLPPFQPRPPLALSPCRASFSCKRTRKQSSVTDKLCRKRDEMRGKKRERGMIIICICACSTLAGFLLKLALFQEVLKH